MLSDKPYLIRAIYDWLLASGCTPYLTVDVHYEGVEVPMEFVEDGKIILNISPDAVNTLDLGARNITFQARFSGRAMDLIVPLGSVLALYAAENGRGMMFDPDEYEEDGGEDEGGSESTSHKGKGSHLSLVK
jgi:stringent starvation protein B